MSKKVFKRRPTSHLVLAMEHVYDIEVKIVTQVKLLKDASWINTSLKMDMLAHDSISSEFKDWLLGEEL
ncbi:MAG: hypothetical protein JKY62_17020 [Desulfocapsa sp.]|nr:hypothetical protein [Desulfocapsa sp.]